MNLALKTTFSIVGAVFSVMIIFSYIEIDRETKTLERQEEAFSRKMLLNALPSIKSAIWSFDDESALAAISPLLENENVISVAIYKEDKSTFVARQKKNRKLSIPELEEFQVPLSGNFVDAILHTA